ncbi:MAG: acyltransferase family protein [Candidatus Pristimantibacillus sp.]
MNNNRIDSLDSLRGIAAMVVVIFHCLLSFVILYEANYNRFANDLMKYFTITPLHTIWAGREAVLLFFVLSGFVLSIPFYKGKVVSYGSYVIRRFFRIYMPYIMIMMASVLLVFLFAEYKDIQGLSRAYDYRWAHAVSLDDIISFILMINYDTANVNGVVWTLFHEMRISLLFPLFLFIIIKFNWIKALVLTLSLNAIFYVALDLLSASLNDDIFSPIIQSFQWSIYYCTFFIAGAILSKYRSRLLALKASGTFTKMLLLAASFVLINCRWVELEYNVKDERITDFISVVGILLLFVVVLTSDRLDKWLTKKSLLWLGKISFSLYLVHIPVMMIVTIFLGNIIPTALAFVLVPFLSMLVAHFTYKYLELPTNKLGKWVAKGFERQPQKISNRVSSNRNL